MTKAIGEVFICQVSLEGVYTMSESRMIAQKGFNPSVTARFDEQGREDMADGR